MINNSPQQPTAEKGLQEQEINYEQEERLNEQELRRRDELEQRRQGEQEDQYYQQQQDEYDHFQRQREQQNSFRPPPSDKYNPRPLPPRPLQAPYPPRQAPPPPPPSKSNGIVDGIVGGVKGFVGDVTCAATSLYTEDKLEDPEFIQYQMKCIFGKGECDEVGNLIKRKFNIFIYYHQNIIFFLTAANFNAAIH